MTPDRDGASLTIAGLAASYRRGDTSPLNVTRMFLDRIRALEPAVGAYITVTAEAAEQEARQAEAELADGRDRGPLHGVPVAVKGCVAVAGAPNTAGSAVLADNYPSEDAPVVARLRRAGAVILGTTNLHELGFGGTTQNPFYGSTRNPWHSEHIPGGSSGGSAAAVAAGECVAAIGTDAGSSVRLPAAMCGCVGLKPTYGRIPTSGAVPLAWSCDHVGPITHTVEDAALLLNALAGFEPGDAGSLDRPSEDFTRDLGRGVRGLRIGYVESDGRGPVEPIIQEKTLAAVSLVQQLGAEVSEVRLPGLSEAVDIQMTIVLGEVGETHRDWFSRQPQKYSAELQRYIGEGLALPAVTYIEALQARRALIVAFRETFAPFDAMIMPAGPLTAPPIGATHQEIAGTVVEVARQLTRFFAAFNLTGQPAVAIPSGISATGLPTGIQIVTKYGEDALALRVSAAVEEAIGPIGRPPLAKVSDGSGREA